MKVAGTETFEMFMARALHDPLNGYYARNIRDIGARGDFTTAPQLSEAPGRAIAAWVAAELRASKSRDVIEIGPGLGSLTGQIMRNLPFPLRSFTRFHLVETSPALSRHQKDLLGKKVRHHKSISSALSACDGNAVIFSNELVDAFPVRLYEKSEGQWHEVAVVHNVGVTREVLIPPAPLPPSSIFVQPFTNGQRVEVHDSYRLWLESWRNSWKRGAMLTIDYGNTAEKLHLRRPKGSLRAYLLHQRSEGFEIYSNPGLRDITADVNFTDLVSWPAQWLTSQKPVNFADFIRPHTAIGDDAIVLAAAHFMALSQRLVRGRR